MIKRSFLKKAAALIAALSMVAAGTAYGAETEAVEPATEAESEDIQIDPNVNKKVALILQQGGLGDEGFNDTAYAGLMECKDKYGIDVNAVECTDTTQGETLIRELCESDYGLIIDLEAGISANMYTVSQDYPDIYFVVVGRQLKFNPVDGFDKTPSNVIESYVTLNEHSFLAGVIAAYAATDGNTLVDGVAQQKGCNIGILFGAESVGFYQYEDGFRQGVQFINPDANVYVDYTVGFTDTANAQTIATNMIKNMGCDVIFTCCGTAGLGGLQACKANNVFGIGVDSNQDDVQPGYILTSAIRDNSSMMEYYVRKYLTNDLHQTEPDVFDLSNGGVNITDMSTISKYITNQENFDRLKDIISECRQWISDGTIEVFDARKASVENDGERLDDWIKTSGKFHTLEELESGNTESSTEGSTES